MLAIVFWVLVVACLLCLAVMLWVDRLVKFDALGETPARVVQIGNVAAMLAFLFFAAALGAGAGLVLS